MDAHSTIVAISSPPGRSLRGLLRVSGPAARDIACRLMADAQAWPPPRRLRPERIRLRSLTAATSLSLPALIAFFRGPASYTGEDMLEIQLPGSPHLLHRLLDYVVQLGARLAEPGEFTFRAFLNGKMDLTQAEGVAAAIAAVGDAQLQAANLLRAGELGRFAGRLADQLAGALALVEAGIDFTDQEDVVPMAPAALEAEIQAARAALSQLLSRCRSYAALGQLPRVVLAGPPNSGKSTLFNALLGRRRAVTSPLPGATRDVLAEPLTLQSPAGRCEVLLLDVAGLDDLAAATLLDQDVQRQARAALQSADLVLLLSAPDAPASCLPPPTGTVLRLGAKSDLPGPAAPSCELLVSALTGENLPQLRTLIAQRLASRAVSLSAQTLALQPRHEAALRSALASLDAAQAMLASCSDDLLPDGELLAHHLRAALDELSALAGKLAPDDVLSRVFATFCIGK